MKKFTYILVTIAVCMVGLALAQSSDWTIRQVRDPVQQREKLNVDGAATAARLVILEASVYTNTASGLTTGNLPLAQMTNGLLTAGPYIGGNIPVASVTNAITATTGVYITNTCIAADAKTNTYVFAPIGGRYVLHSISTSP